MKLLTLMVLLLCLSAVNAQVCNTTAPRKDCGFIGVNKDSCVNQLGCCWDESAIPYCFQSSGTQTTTSVVVPSTSSTSSTSATGTGTGTGTVTFGNNSWTTTYQFTGGVSFCSQCGQPGQYECSDTNIGGNLSAGSYLPANNIVTSLTVEILGSYGCASTSSFAEIVVYINDMPFTSIDLTPKSCVCNTCDGKIKLPVVAFPLGINWSSSTKLNINIFGNSVCLAEAALTVTYAPTKGYNSIVLEGTVPKPTGSALVCGQIGAYAIDGAATVTLATFSDPLPEGKLALGIALNVLGNFFYVYSSSGITSYCQTTASATFGFDGEVFDTTSISQGTPQTSQVRFPSCGTPFYSNSGCNAPWYVASPFFQAGLPGYVYGGTNKLTFKSSSSLSATQIASVNIVIYYV